MSLFPPENTQRKCSISSQNPEYDQFIQDNEDFFLYGPCQSSILMIDKILMSSSIPEELCKQPLRHLIMQIFNEIALNQLQVALWSLFIEQYVWNSCLVEVRLGLIFSAILTKEYLGENIEYLLLRYTEKDGSFKEKYNFWASAKNLNIITIIDINREYKRLRNGKKRPINYNFYVDEIILQYLPYSNPKKKNEIDMEIKIEQAQAGDSQQSVINETICVIDEELLQSLPLLQLVPRTTSNGSKSMFYSDSGGSGVSKYLNFGV